MFAKRGEANAQPIVEDLHGRFAVRRVKPLHLLLLLQLNKMHSRNKQKTRIV